MLREAGLDAGERRLAVGKDEVEDAGGQAAGDEQLVEGRRDGGGVFGRLPNGGVAADERRYEVPRRDGDGEVPRRHDGNGPDGDPVGEERLVVHLRRHGLPVQAAPLTEEEVARVDDLLNLAERLGIRLSHLTRHEAGEGLLVRLHEPSDLSDRPPPDRGRDLGPRLLGGLRDPAGVGEGGGAREGDIGDDLVEMGRIG